MKTRFFLIALIYQGSFLNITCKTPGVFISESNIRTSIGRATGELNVNEYAVISIYEFDCEKDYNDYTGEGTKVKTPSPILSLKGGEA